MKKIIILYFTVILGICNACDYLDVVPDNIATLDNAFTNRTMAEKYLFTCYSYMPPHGSLQSAAFLIGDEYWKLADEISENTVLAFTTIAKGNQAANSPVQNYWDGLRYGTAMFVALRDCNIFIERMEDDIPRLDDLEKKRWVSEVKCLKAYYHYWLLRMYGPIPLIKKNLPISASIEEVQVKRDPVDECFDYIVSLLDEAVADLPLVSNETMELGRFTQPMALALKAKVLVEAASPLFNGNTDYANFKRKEDNVQYFNQTYDISKWKKAALACRNAIDTCHLAGFELFQFSPGITENASPEIITQMSIRNSVCESDPVINREVIWADPNSTTSSLATASWPFVEIQMNGPSSWLSVPLKIVEMFYTANGVPIDEDSKWEESGNYRDRYTVGTATDDDKYNIRSGYETLTLNLNREPRFYATLTFDGNLWYGFNKFDCNDQWVIQSKMGQINGTFMIQKQNVTGYSYKKFVHYRNAYTSNTSYTTIAAPFPVIRLADLYLLYSEALNEAYGPSQEAYKWIDLVRKRAGLEGVEVSWAKYAKSSYQNKPTTQDGFRKIIHHERLIELSSEGQRYWEIRRWKRGREIWNNQPIQGLDVTQSETVMYNRVRTLFIQNFTSKNYLWPLRDHTLLVNPNLDQNPGW